MDATTATRPPLIRESEARSIAIDLLARIAQGHIFADSQREAALAILNATGGR